MELFLLAAIRRECLPRFNIHDVMFEMPLVGCVFASSHLCVVKQNAVVVLDLALSQATVTRQITEQIVVQFIAVGDGAGGVDQQAVASVW